MLYISTLGGEYKSFSSYNNAISKHTVIKEFAIGIARNATFDGSNSFSDDMKLERLSLCDVTQIEITYDDESKELYFVEWDCENDDCEYRNDRQSYTLTDSKNVLFQSWCSDSKPKTEEYNNETCVLIDMLVSMNTHGFNKTQG